jgi:membrane protein required for beta-lactamase induction
MLSMPVVETGILETIVVGIPRVVKAMEDLPVEQLWSVLGAVEGSYRRSLARWFLSIGLPRFDIRHYATLERSARGRWPH